MLLGTQDQVWDEWDSSKEVSSEAVGDDRELAPVVEERNLPRTEQRIMPDQWLDLAAKHSVQIGELNGATSSVTAKLGKTGHSGNQSTTINNNTPNNSPPITSTAPVLLTPLGDAPVEKGQKLALASGKQVIVKVATNKTHVWVLIDGNPVNTLRTDLYLV